MTCTACREQLDELVLDELPPRRKAELRAHLDGCAACTRALEETRATLSLLHRLDEELPSDFGSSLHLKLAASPPPEPPGFLFRLRDALRDLLLARPRVTMSLSLGAALAAALLFVAGRSHLPAPQAQGSQLAAAVPTGEVPPIFVVPRTKVAVVRIDFLAEQDIDDVEFAIALPEGLHFVSEGRELPEREFRWKGRLERGSNPIPVAVRGARAGRYTLAARALGTDLDARQNVVLEVTSG